jgi:hypothetical protein
MSKQSRHSQLIAGAEAVLSKWVRSRKVKKLIEPGEQISFSLKVIEGKVVVGDISEDSISDVRPKITLATAQIHNRSCELVRPAVLTAEEVKKLLSQFLGIYRTILYFVLVKNRNEPSPRGGVTGLAAEFAEDQHWYPQYSELKSGKAKVVIGTTQYRLMIGTGMHKGMFQLWEIKPKASSAPS